MESRGNESLPLLQLSGICLEYGPVQALKRLNLGIRAAESHAIVGEHGAGKSSLGMIISGMLKPGAGTIRLDGRDYSSLSLKTALRLGIRMVYQQIYLNEHFSVAEHIFFTDKRLSRFTLYHRRRVEREARALLDSFGLDINESALLRNLSLSDRTVVDIVKHLRIRPRILILDEALEKVSAQSLACIRPPMEELRRSGMAIVSITHKIDDIYDLADRVTILRSGEVLVTDEVRNIDKISLIRMTYTQFTKDESGTALSKEFYQLLKYNEAILQHLPVNLIVTDDDHRIKMVNEYCKNYFHLSRKTFLNQPLERIFGGNEAVLALIRENLHDREEHTAYQVKMRIGEETTTNNIKTFPIFDGGYHIGNIIIIEDVSEYDRLQKQFILSEKLASLGLLAAGVAHEINNPLEIISNYLSYMKYSFHNKDLRDSIEKVDEEISTIAKIVGNLVSFSDNNRLMNEPVLIDEVIQSLLDLVQYNAKDKAIHIHFEPGCALAPITASRTEMKQVVLNLLKNSFEAMPEGGDIHIHTEPYSQSGKEYVRIRFADTGPGIPDANPSNVFLPFYTTKKAAGDKLGLGLSVSYAIVRKYRGEISVANCNGGGCQFTILIPT